MNENSWENVPEDVSTWFGFVYRITCISNGKKYIGKKQFWSNQKRPPLKGQKRSRRVTKESDWKKYYGSCPELKDDIVLLGKDKFKRSILSLHKTLGKTNYEETKQLFLNNVLIEALEDGCPKYYNSNILGRYYRKDYFNKEFSN